VSESKINDNIVSWTFENYAAVAGLFSGVAICLLVFYIYSRSGSLIFLRDMMWRFFGGSEKFEDTTYEIARKNLREIEHYRFEFNIPAQNLTQAKQAEEWISKNELCHREVSKIRTFIDWKEFNALTLKEKLFSKAPYRILIGLLILFFAIITVTPPLAGSEHLMVSLRNAPETPSFYLSESGAKFHFWTNTTLTTTECLSPESLKKFINTDFSENRINTICNLFLDSNYSAHVKDGVKEQKAFLLVVAFISILVVFFILVKLNKITIARKIQKQIESKTATSPQTP
jgi:hypothetical protein